MNKPHSPSTVATRQDPSLPDSLTEQSLASWRPSDEAVILARVKQQVRSHYRGETIATKPTDSVAGWPRLVWWGVGAMAGLLLMLLVPWRNKPKPVVYPPKPVLEFSGSIERRTLAKFETFRSGFIRAETKPTEHGEIRWSGRWRLRARRHTQLTLSPPGLQQRVYLHRGQIQVDVTPRTMKSFVVYAQSVQIAVKGTAFSVEQSTHWLRVEVTEGQVLIVIPKHAKRMLPASMGMRWDSKTQEMHTYPLPPSQFHHPRERWRWMWKQQGPKTTLRYLLDLAQSHQYSWSQKERWLMNAADLARRQQNYALEYQLYLWMYRHSTHPDNKADNKEYKLFQAAQSCRKAFSALHTPCVRLYREYLQQFLSSNPAYRDTSHYWYTRSQAIQAKTPKVAQQIWRQYLIRSPHSYYRNQVARWVISIQQGTFVSLCRELNRMERTRMSSSSWLQAHCGER